ncbi:MAG: VWA domain-containing protein [Alphaproteobacteria bacterium]|nr:VWA domain-containing protein [Alphaproteobacteria bacterium]
MAEKPKDGKGVPVPAKGGVAVAAKGAGAAVEQFLHKVAVAPRRGGTGRGRLIFAMDATASREPTWDQACHIQGEMFTATDALGGLEVQLVFYRGFGECKASPWMASSADLVRRMTAVSCLGGHTQIGRVLKHAVTETNRKKVDALVFVGDAMEEEVDELSHGAGELGLLGVPAFIFHEGYDPVAARGFRQIAKLTKGAYCAFDAGSAEQLKALLSAVAVFAAGGRPALEDLSREKGGVVKLLTSDLA